MRSLYKTMMILGATAMMAWPALAAKHQGYIEFDVGMGSSGVELDKASFAQGAKEDNSDTYYGVSLGVLFPMTQAFSFGGEIGYSNGPDQGAEGAAVENQFGPSEVKLTDENIEFMLSARMQGQGSAFAVVAKLGMVKPVGALQIIDDGNVAWEYPIIGWAPKLYLAGQYTLKQHWALSLFFANQFGESASTASEVNDYIFKNDDDNELKPISVMAYGLGINYYF